MAKAVVLEYVDADPGADDNNIVLLARVLFIGVTVPNSPLIDLGVNGNGVPIAWNITGTTAQFSNNVETALAARATQLGFSLANTDVLFPSFSRGT
jgi:hypothetical protein